MNPLLVGNGDDDEPKSDDHIVSVSVTAETLDDLNTILEQTDAPDYLRAPLRREISQYHEYANYTPTFSSSIASAILYFGSTSAVTMLFSASSPQQYISSARTFTVAYYHGLREAYDRDPSVSEENVREIDQLIELFEQGPGALTQLSDAFSDSTVDSGVFDADQLDADVNPFTDDQDDITPSEDEDNHIEERVEDNGRQYRVESEQLDKDPEFAEVDLDEIDDDGDDPTENIDSFLEEVDAMLDDIKSEDDSASDE